MHRTELTEKGILVARQRLDANTDAMELYPNGYHGVGDDERWTEADDILCWLFTDHIKPIADDSSYTAQQKAVIKAVSPPLPRGHTAIAFKALCRDGLVNCVYDFVSASVDFVKVFFALGNPLRWEVLSLAYPEPASTSRICQRTGKIPAGIYHHLRRLEDAGLLYSLGRNNGYLADREYLVNVLQSVLELLGEEEVYDD